MFILYICIQKNLTIKICMKVPVTEKKTAYFSNE